MLALPYSTFASFAVICNSSTANLARWHDIWHWNKEIKHICLGKNLSSNLTLCKDCFTNQKYRSRSQLIKYWLNATTQWLSQHWKVTKSNQGISLNELAALKLRSKIWTNFTSHTLLALLLVFKKLPEYEYESVTGDTMTLSLKRTRTVIDREPWKSSWDGSSSNYSSRYLKTTKFSNFCSGWR